MASSENGDSGNSPMKKMDCFFFVQYGLCSYGENCKYNHPPREEDSQIVKEESGENYTRKYPCKFYRNGYCKYGSYCGFNHSIPYYPPLQYNSDGLPMRLGARVCSFYTNNRWCGYGATCKFHHPELNYFVAQEYGSDTFGEAQEYLEGPLRSTTDGELVSNNE